MPGFRHYPILAGALLLTALLPPALRAAKSGGKETATQSHDRPEPKRVKSGLPDSTGAHPVAGDSLSHTQALVVEPFPAPVDWQRKPEHRIAPEVGVQPKAQRTVARGSVLRSHRPASPPRETFTPVDPLGPGNWLPAPGGALLVQGFHSPAGVAATQLELQPAPFTPSSSASPQKSTSPAAGDSTATLVSDSPDRPGELNRPGLTYQQELFRTKWGWSAFDQAQRKRAQLEAEQ